MSKVLQCHSKGDRRFSALYAHIEIFGKSDSIERIYQASKRFNNNNKKGGKGKYPDYLIINGRAYSNDILSEWYRYLWHIYFIQNKDLFDYAKSFDIFVDIFANDTMNNQAKTIRELVKSNNEMTHSFLNNN